MSFLRVRLRKAGLHSLTKWSSQNFELILEALGDDRARIAIHAVRKQLLKVPLLCACVCVVCFGFDVWVSMFGFCVRLLFIFAVSLASLRCTPFVSFSSIYSIIHTRAQHAHTQHTRARR